MLLGRMPLLEAEEKQGICLSCHPCNKNEDRKRCGIRCISAFAREADRTPFPIASLSGG